MWSVSLIEGTNIEGFHYEYKEEKGKVIDNCYAHPTYFLDQVDILSDLINELFL